MAIFLPLTLVLGAALWVWLAGTYNQLVTLHKRAWDAWREVHATDLRVIREFADAGDMDLSRRCDEFEAASHRAMAMLGDMDAMRAAQSLRAELLGWVPPGTEPSWQSGGEVAMRSYLGFAGAYNKELRKPAGRLVALASGLRALPEV